MPLVQLCNVNLSFGARRVLEGVSTTLHRGDRVGLIGANGSGKTSLLRVIAGRLVPESGAVHVRRGLRIGLLEQEPDLPRDGTVLQAALAALDEVAAIERRMREIERAVAEASPHARPPLLKELGRLQQRFEHARGYERESRAAAVLAGVGFRQEELDRPVASLSGGERSRLALAQILLHQADLLLLDEPTNHLDLQGVEWLEEFLLKKYRGAVVLVAHDRAFLDRTVTRIAELSEGRLAEYPGNYAAYVALKAERLRAQERAFEKQQAFVAKEEEFYRRYHAAQRAREAKGRMKRLARIERLEAPRDERSISLEFALRRDPAEICLRAEGLAKGYGGRLLFQNLDLEVKRGERIGIVGPNGCGKTTLLKTLLGLLPPDSGRVRIGQNVVVGYLPQIIADLAPDRTILDEVWERRRTLTEAEVRGLLGRFLFSGDDVLKRLGDLSGGERKRVVFASLIVVEAPNLLFLDEPTNHLDIASREALEAALADFPGTIVAVSHDRYFLNRIADRLIVMDGRSARVFHGRYADYAAERDAARRPPAPAESPRPKSGPRRAPRLSKNRLARLEQEISALERERTSLEAAMADPANYANPEKARSLPARYAEVKAALERLYDLWTSQEG